MHISPGPCITASADALDEEALDEVLNVWNQAQAQAHAYREALSGIREEEKHVQEQRERSSRTRAKHAARKYAERLRQAYEDKPDFFKWNENRALNLMDFDYFFYHRHQPYLKGVRKWLEIAAAKIIHINEDGRPAYFNKLERNIGWRQYITPLIFAAPAITDKLVRCGLWANAHNSRRCHQKDFCALCLWNDILKPLYIAFGSRSGAFYEAPAWLLITIGWTTNPLNARCSSDDFHPDDIRPPAGDRGYDPYPVVLGLDDADPDCAWRGYEDARILGLAMQEAIGGLHHCHHVDGYHYHLEGEYRLNPGGANRVNLHSHTVANGRVEDAHTIVDALKESVLSVLRNYGPLLSREYYPDIQVKRITTPQHLERCVAYTEKVVPVGHMVADAMSRPEAKLPDGNWKERYTIELRASLCRLADDDIPALLTSTQLELDLPRLLRRKTVGNMTFNDRGTCIGDEPDWHVENRRKHAAKQKKRRQELKRERERLAAAGEPVPAPRKYRRRNVMPPRFARSLRRIQQQQSNQFTHDTD
jgi:hypothetical protein